MSVIYTYTLNQTAAHELSMVFTLLNGWGEVKKRIYVDVWQSYEMQTSVSINSFNGTQ